MIYLIIFLIDKLLCLIGVSKTTHTRHDTEDIVVSSVDVDLCRATMGYCGRGEVDVKGTVINTRHVTTTRWLMFLRFETEGVDIHASCWDVCVVLVRLNQVKVAPVALGEAVLTVKLDLGG